MASSGRRRRQIRLSRVKHGRDDRGRFRRRPASRLPREVVALRRLGLGRWLVLGELYLYGADYLLVCNAVLSCRCIVWRICELFCMCAPPYTCML